MTATVLRRPHADVAAHAELVVDRLVRWSSIDAEDARVIREGIRGQFTAADDGHAHELLRAALERLAVCSRDIASPEPGYPDDHALDVLAGLCPALPDPADRVELWGELLDTALALYDLQQDGPDGQGLTEPLPYPQWQARVNDLESDLDGCARRAAGTSTGTEATRSVGEGELGASAPATAVGGAS